MQNQVRLGENSHNLETVCTWVPLWPSCPVCGPGLSSYFLFFLRRQEQFQRNPDSYNGAVRENYAWSQDYTDLELKVPVPKHVVKGKQVTSGVLPSFSAQLLSLGHRLQAVGCTGAGLPVLPPTQNCFFSAVTSLPPHILFNHVKYETQPSPLCE